MRNLSRLILTTVVGLALVTGVALVSAQNTPTPDTSATTSGAPYLGITYQAADNGVEVSSVLPNSPAADAGLKTGDLITSINGSAVTADTLPDVIHGMAVGDTLTLDVTRAGETMQLTATLAAQPARSTLRIQPFMRARGAWLGISLENTTDSATIAAVTPSSPADKAGLKAGDVITAVNGQSVTTPADVVSAIGGMNPGDTVTLTITRDGASQDITATLDTARSNRPDVMMGDVVIYDGTNWRIVSLADDSPLATAGVQAGDVITAINGESYDPAGLTQLLDGMDSSAPVTLTVERNGQSQDLTVTAGDLAALNHFGFGFGPDFPRNFGRGQGFGFDMMPGSVRLGVEFQTLNADIARQHNLSVTDGALITNVLPDTPAATAGLKVNDVVVAVDGDPVDAQRTLAERLLAYQAGDTVTLDVLRDGSHMNIDVTLAEVNPGDMMPMPFGFNGEMPHFFFGPRGPQGNMPMNPAQPVQPQAQATPKANL